MLGRREKTEKTETEKTERTEKGSTRRSGGQRVAEKTFGIIDEDVP